MDGSGLRERPDGALIALCQASPAELPRAFRVLYERHSDPVYAYLRAFLGDESLAEDALQDAFVRLFRSLESYDSARPLKPYITRLAHNAAIDLVRGRKSKRPQPLREIAGASQPADEAARRETAAGVDAALADLDPDVRAILLLRHVQELKLREIAEVLGCTERTARNRLRAAARLLEGELTRRGVAPKEAKP